MARFSSGTGTWANSKTQCARKSVSQY